MLSFNFELADFVARLRLGSKSHYAFTTVRRNNLSFEILQLLYDNGVIRGFFCERLTIKVFLKYHSGHPVIRNLELITRPSVRAYWSIRFLTWQYNFHSLSGFYVLSTSRGILTSHQCMFFGLSGEALFKVCV